MWRDNGPLTPEQIDRNFESLHNRLLKLEAQPHNHWRPTHESETR